jgi:HAD superfamily hydrolase (TIGR01509 family)
MRGSEVARKVRLARPPGIAFDETGDMSPPLHPPGAALKTILLDIDGTLIDSNDGHARAWVAAFAAHGYTVPFDAVRPLIGKGGDKLLPELTGLDPESPQGKAISASRSELFRAKELPQLRATPGARALLQRLRDEGLELAVATSAQADEVTAILTQAGVDDLIEMAASSGDADASKPDPDIVQAALRKAGRLPSQSVMMGDTPYDVEAASRARVPTIVFRCGGFWSDRDFSDALAIYDDPADLVARYDESPLATGRPAAVREGRV